MAADDIEPLAQAPFASLEGLILARDGLVPDLVVDPITFAAGAGFRFAARQVDLDEISDRARDGGRADFEKSRQLRDRQGRGIGRDPSAANTRAGILGKPDSPGPRQSVMNETRLGHFAVLF